MSLTLILTRHAKSSWDTPKLDDFDRPLNARGEGAAKAIGTWLAFNGHVPDSVVLSGARRTVETWSGIATCFQGDVTVTSNRALYLAPSAVILDVLRKEKSATVMLIGHNPGIADFADRVLADTPEHPRFFDYPTGATTVIRFEVPSWGSATWGTGETLDFVVPRDLD